jgi:hypothetical protein
MTTIETNGLETRRPAATSTSRSSGTVRVGQALAARLGRAGHRVGVFERFREIY